jgi:hypothetical protein
MDDLAPMARLVNALRPWLGKLVVVGGWAHRLHRYSDLANPPGYQPILTLDADLAFSLGESLEGNIAQALRAAEFREVLSGEHRPPVSHYTLGREGGGFYAEFLAPLVGSATRRNGEPNATMSKAGITAQKLRYMDVLLVHPTIVELGGPAPFPLDPPAEVKLANPVSFVVQKLLIQHERRPEKRPNDVLYIHDTLDLFAEHMDGLEEIWRERVRPSLAPRTARRVEQLARDQFNSVTDDIRAAARIPQDRTLTPDDVRSLCAYGLDAIFGLA